MNRSYSELIALPTFEERYRYLRLDGRVGEETFGFDRYMNQKFYQTDALWRSLRQRIIIRDNGCDLGVEGREIHGRIIIHHINPITIDDILRRSDLLYDPENLICTIKNTHDAIHYGDEKLLFSEPIIRTKNDTCPWRR